MIYVRTSVSHFFRFDYFETSSKRSERRLMARIGCTCEIFHLATALPRRPLWTTMVRVRLCSRQTLNQHPLTTISTFCACNGEAPRKDPAEDRVKARSKSPHRERKASKDTGIAKPRKSSLVDLSQVKAVVGPPPEAVLQRKQERRNSFQSEGLDLLCKLSKSWSKCASNANEKAVSYS